MNESEKRYPHLISTYFHLVHTLLRVPMQESLTLEHGRELVIDTLEEFLDGGRVAQEGNGHLASTRWDVTLGSEDVIGDPFHKVSRVLVLDVLHLLFDFLHRYFATEDGSDLVNKMLKSCTYGRCTHNVR